MAKVVFWLVNGGAKRLVGAALLAGASSCGAQTTAAAGPPLKVAVITLQETVLATREGQVAAAPLQAKYGAMQKQLSEQQARVELLQKQLHDLPASSTDAERMAVEKDLDQEERVVGSGSRQAAEQYGNDLKQALATLEPKVRAVAVKMARERGYQALIDVSDPNVVLWYSPMVNLSEDVVKAYDLGAVTPAPLPLMMGGGTSVNPVAVIDFGQDVLNSSEGQKTLGEMEKRHTAAEQPVRALQLEVAALQRKLAGSATTAELVEKQQKLARASDELNRAYQQDMHETLQRAVNQVFAGMTQYAEGRGYRVLVNQGISQAMVVWAAAGVDAAALNARAARIDAEVLQALKAK